MNADTPEQIAAFVALALKGALFLESKGMRRRGESALAQVRRLHGIKARTAAEALPLYIAKLEAAGILQAKGAAK